MLQTQAEFGNIIALDKGSSSRTWDSGVVGGVLGEAGVLAHAKRWGDGCAEAM